MLGNSDVVYRSILLFYLLCSEWTETFPNDFKDEVMMMHIKDITSYCASLTLVCTDRVNFFTVKK